MVIPLLMTTGDGSSRYSSDKVRLGAVMRHWDKQRQPERLEGCFYPVERDGDLSQQETDQITMSLGNRDNKGKSKIMQEKYSLYSGMGNRIIMEIDNKQRLSVPFTQKMQEPWHF